MSNQVLNNSEDEDTTTFLGNLSQWLIMCIVKKVFFFCLNGISCILICASCLFTFHWYYWKEYFSIFLTTPHWVLIHIDQRHQSLPFPSLNSQCLFICQVHHSVCPCHFCAGGPELDIFYQCTVKGKDHFIYW